MRSGIMTSTAVFLLGTGLALAEPPTPPAAVQAQSAHPAATTNSPPITTGSVSPAPTAFAEESQVGVGNVNPGPVDQEAGAAGSRLYVNSEFLLWKYDGGLPADLSAALTGTGFDPTILADTLPLNSWYSGVRSTIGLWLDPSHLLGFEVGGFVLAERMGTFDTTVTIDPSVNPSAIPQRLFLQPVVGGLIQVANSRGVVDPPPGSGDLDSGDSLTSHLTGTSSSQMWGTETNVRSTRLYFGTTSFDFLAGFCNANLDESLTFKGDFTFMEPEAGGDPDELPGNPENGRTVTMHTTDSVSTQNHFYGAQVGTSFETVWNRFIVNGTGKFAVGGTWERVDLVGTTHLDPANIEPAAGLATIPRPATDLPGGLITPAVPGGFTSHADHFSIIPQLGANVGYQLTNSIRAYVGYNIMYWTNVARTKDQSIQFPTSATSNLTIQGVDFGLQFRY